MNLISLENIEKSYVEKILLDRISLGINEGDKIGIIGINGTGKSTLLKIIAGVEEPNDGKITKKSGIRVEYLSQNTELNPDGKIIEEVFRGNSPQMQTIRAYMQAIKDENTDPEEMTKLLGKMEEYRCWNLESEAKAVLNKLGVEDFEREIKTLSGGQKKRVSLASALTNPSDLLVLDEPTNHLDSETISWLENYLNDRDGAIIMITHDRYFLDKVANRIVELDGGKLHEYGGNYSYFLGAKLEREEIEASTYKKKKSLLKKELEWMRKGAKARTTKQKARIQRYESLEDEVQGKETKNDMEISVNRTRLGNKIIEAENIEKSMGSVKLIDGFTYTAVKGDRIGIVGKNGVGKSTLLKILSGKEPVDSGRFELGETVNIGVFSQETYHMDESQRIIEYIKEGAEYAKNKEGYKMSASQMLETFLFPPHVQGTFISKLSGGEKRRLYLLRVLLEGPNVLFLDEPTNDLDIETLSILEDYLDEFEGVVITVSHDRYFLDRVVSRIFAFENGAISDYPGNYSDYQSRVDSIAEVGPEITDKKELKKESGRQENRDKKLKFSYNEKREYETIDKDIAELEEAIEKLDLDMAEAASEYTKLQELMEKKSSLEEKLEKKMERWVYLTEIAEKIEEQK
jgi:ABC transport system ATP-binding/permease protein